VAQRHPHADVPIVPVVHKEALSVLQCAICLKDFATEAVLRMHCGKMHKFRPGQFVNSAKTRSRSMSADQSCNVSSPASFNVGLDEVCSFCGKTFEKLSRHRKCPQRDRASLTLGESPVEPRLLRSMSTTSSSTTSVEGRPRSMSVDRSCASSSSSFVEAGILRKRRRRTSRRKQISRRKKGHKNLNAIVLNSPDCDTRRWYD